jgi:RecJ-like exonuclease
MFRIVALLLVVPLFLGCASMMREFGAQKEWETCKTPTCALCSGTGQIECTKCTPQGETQCGPCHGSGMADHPVKSACGHCQARGYLYTATGRQVECTQCGATGETTVYEKRQCTTCGGRGWGACSDCGGDKQMQHGRWVKVYEDGQRVPKPWTTAP